jgi:hypothetical protein
MKEKYNYVLKKKVFLGFIITEYSHRRYSKRHAPLIN